MSQEPTETSPYKKLLGRGTYGEVYLIDTSDESTEGETEKPPSPSLDNFRYVKKYIHKYTRTDKDDIILEQTSIREIAIHRILSRYNNPYLLSFYSLKNKTSKYRLKFKYKGIPLDEWCKKTSKENRLKLLPHILYSLLLALIPFEENNFIHGDIKPQNILIDENNNITLIDYGSCVIDPTIVFQVDDPDIFNMCTYPFSSPEMLNLENRVNTIDHRHDIFSLGMITRFIINPVYQDKEDTFILFCLRESYKYFPIYDLGNDLEPHLKNLLMDFLTIHIDMRPTASKLLHHSYFKNLNKDSYSHIHNYVYWNNNITLSPLYLINVKKREDTLELIYTWCKKYKCEYILAHSMILFDNYIYNNEVKEKNYHLIALVCFLVSECLLRCSSFTFNYMYNTLGEKRYTGAKILKYISKIVMTAKDYLYHRSFDYYLRKKRIYKLNYDIVFKILFSHQNKNKSIEELIHLYNTFSSDEKKKKEE